MKFFNFKIVFFVFTFSFSKTLLSQCINTFPNTQNFESSPTWTSGGANSDWAWGSPTKAIITSAGTGTKCWVIGGLTGNNYNGSQQSFIESPCYDFSTLTYPTATFKVFWEMEYRYDGAGLQYSLNNGVSWQMLGAFNDPINCNTQNWFNYSTVNFLSWAGSKNGWSGNSMPNSGNCQGGNGSLGWVTATHCLSNLAGKPNVKFRFVFGSGLTCNGFDGFAIDDFTIDNAVTSPVTFTNTCANFISINPAICQSTLSYFWDFGDTQNIASNTSTLTNPTYIFSNPGVYNVSLSTTGGPCGAKTSFTKTVSVLGSSISSQSNVTCKGGNNGGATVVALNSNSNLTYTWSPEGGNTATANSLIAGNYSVFIADGNGCKSTSTLNITEPNATTGASSQTIVSCLGNASILQVVTAGITDPISYFWLPGGYTTNSINIVPLATSVYTVNVTIAGACPKFEQKLFTTQVVPKPTISFTNSTTQGCVPLCINFIDKSSTASGSITSNFWQFSNGSFSDELNPTICFNKAGIYKASYGVLNNYGCSNFKDSILTIAVFPTPIANFIADKYEFTDLEETQVNFKDLSTANPNSWEWNFAGQEKSYTKNTNYKFTTSGVYPILLNVTNEYGCSASASQTINVLPEFTFYVPNTFTPNGDNLNDVFLAKGRGWDETSFKLLIFNRWGKKIFSTQDVNQGWNGKVNNTDVLVEDDIYIYKIELNDNSKKLHSYLGNITVIK